MPLRPLSASDPDRGDGRLAPGSTRPPSQTASSSSVVRPRTTRIRSTTSPTTLFGVEAPAVRPTATGPAGSRPPMAVSSCAPPGRWRMAGPALDPVGAVDVEGRQPLRVDPGQRLRVAAVVVADHHHAAVRLEDSLRLRPLPHRQRGRTCGRARQTRGGAGAQGPAGGRPLLAKPDKAEAGETTKML